MGKVAARARGSRDRHLGQPALGGAARDHPGRAPGRRLDVEIDPDRRSAIQQGGRARRARRRRGRRRQGPRAGTGDRRRPCIPSTIGRSCARRSPRCARRAEAERAVAESTLTFHRSQGSGSVTWTSATGARDPARARRRSRRSGSGGSRAATHRRRPSRPISGRLAGGRGRGTSSSRSTPASSYVDDARARGAATLVPDDQEAALAALASLVRSKSDARVVAVVGSAGKTSTKDILGALCAPHAPTICGREEPQQRDRAAADRLPARAGDRDPRHRDGHARARPDRGALRDRPARHRRRLAHRPRAPRARSAASSASPRRTRRRSPRFPAAAPRSSPRSSRELEPYPEPRRHRAAALRLRPTSSSRTRAGASALDGTVVELELPFTQRHHAREHARRAPRLCGARARRSSARHEGAARDPALALARRGDGAAGRRLRRQRRLQRQPGLDARGARAPRRASRRPAPRRDPRRDGRARRVRASAITARSASSPRSSASRSSASASRRGRTIRRPGLRTRRRPSKPHATFLRPGDAVLVKASRAVGLEGIAAEITNIARAWSQS